MKDYYNSESWSYCFVELKNKAKNELVKPYYWKAVECLCNNTMKYMYVRRLKTSP